MPKPSAKLLAEKFYEFKRSAADGCCWVKGCRRASRKEMSLCHMHEMRRWRTLNKKTADYCTLRDHAKARRIKFTITLDYWRGLVDAYGFYNRLEGDDTVLTIDRVDPTLGYVEGNMRVVTINQNSYKSNRERYLPEHVQHMLERKRAQTQQEKEKYLGLDPPPVDDLEFEDDVMHQYEEIEDDNCPF